MIDWPVEILQNKYSKWYEQIVIHAQARGKNPKRDQRKKKDPTPYTEVHHIIPASIGGSNKINNLVRFSAREHFICHWLLTKMTVGESRSKMLYALKMMRNAANHQKRYITKITSRVYGNIKEECSKIQSEKMKGHSVSAVSREKASKSMKAREFSEEHKKNITAAGVARRGIPKGPMSPERYEKHLVTMRSIVNPMLGKKHSDEARKKMSKSQQASMTPERRANLSERSKGENNPRYGAVCSDETRAKIGAKSKGRTHSPETRAKMSESHKGKPCKPKTLEERKALSIASKNRAKITCPHCARTIDSSNYKTWHGDNCKMKPK